MEKKSSGESLDTDMVGVIRERMQRETELAEHPGMPSEFKEEMLERVNECYEKEVVFLSSNTEARALEIYEIACWGNEESAKTAMRQAKEKLDEEGPVGELEW